MPVPDTMKTGTAVKPAGWAVFFALLAVQAGGALAWLVTIASDPKNRRLLGLSSSRLALAAALLGAALGLGWLALRSGRDARLRQRLERLVLQKYYRAWAAALLAGAWLLPAVGFVLRYRPGASVTLFERLLPVLAFALAACLSGLVGLALARRAELRARFAGQRGLLLAAGTALAGLLGLGMIMTLTGLGLVPDAVPDGWGTPGVPLLEGQIWLALSAAGLLFLAGRWARERGAGLSRVGWRLDALLSALVWLAAVGIWLAQPVRTGYFLPEPRAPNYEYQPYSDAITSGLTAQEILLGNGFNNGEIITRPLYVLGLAGLHAAAGRDYLGVIALQTLLLAFFPVVLFWLGRLAHGRIAGLLVAAFAILREVNAIAGTAYSGVSNSKLLMSDLPTALAVSLVVLLAVLWLRPGFTGLRPGFARPRRWLLPLAAGGVLGLAGLVRLQALLLAPFLALAGLLWALRETKRDALPRRNALKTWLVGSVLLALGVVLAVAPWAARNYRITGRVVLDQPVESQLFAGLYSYSGRVSYPRLPGENDGAYSARLMGKVVEFVRADPGYVAKFIAGHTLNNLVDTLLVLPVRRDPVNRLDEVLALKNSFWLLWDGRVSALNGLLALVYLIWIAVGMGAAWRRLGWAGLLPLFVLAGYSLSNAVSRNSGWRYILPADWAGYFYFAMGAVQGLAWLARLFEAQPRAETEPEPQNVPAGRFPAGKLAALSGLILLAGMSLPLAEVVVPKAYPPAEQEELARQLLALDGLEGAGVENFLRQPGAVIARGQVIYPRFYAAKEGEPGSGWRLFQPMAYAHLSFFVVGSSEEVVVLPTAESPARIPPGSEAWVVGCRGSYWLEPLVVVLPESGTLLWRGTGGPGLACNP